MFLFINAIVHDTCTSNVRAHHKQLAIILGFRGALKMVNAQGVANFPLWKQFQQNTSNIQTESVLQMHNAKYKNIIFLFNSHEAPHDYENLKKYTSWEHECHYKKSSSKLLQKSYCNFLLWFRLGIFQNPCLTSRKHQSCQTSSDTVTLSVHRLVNTYRVK